MYVCFLTRDRKGLCSDGKGGGEDLGVGGGGETLIRMYCGGGESIFNKRKIEKDFKKKKNKISCPSTFPQATLRELFQWRFLLFQVTLACFKTVKTNQHCKH